MTACVFGLGKIGLPLAVQFANQGVATVGVDIAAAVVDSINAGIPPFDEPGLAPRLQGAIGDGLFRADTSSAVVTGCDVVVVVVPLVIDHGGTADFTNLDAATTAIGRGIRRGALVVYETTVPVGTTRQRCVPVLERLSGLVAGTDFQVAYSPERVSSGSVFADLGRYPKLVGGIDEASAKAATAFYEQVLTFDERSDLARPNGVWNLGTTEAAEFAKLAETTYRDVNIALANEFAAHAEGLGVDIGDVIAAANSQPYSHIHRPGIAVGGHCIPVYPHLYLAGDRDALLPGVARQVNRAQPPRLVARLAAVAGGLEGATVAVLGAAYRGGVKETAFSGVFDVVAAITSQGGRARVHDPLYGDDELRALGFEPYHLGEACDAAVVHTDHDRYRTLAPADLVGCTAVLDGRRILDPVLWRGTGVAVVTVGR